MELLSSGATTGFNAVVRDQDGKAMPNASVTVVQTPVRLDIVSGNDQGALRGTALAEPLVVSVAEQTGGVIPGLVVTFAPADDRSGSVSERQVTTGADGTASTMWTLGEARRQGVVATAGELTETFRAAATADPPHS